MDTGEFVEWYSNFFKRHGGFKPTDVPKWFEKVEKVHEPIRGFLGADKLSRFYKLKSQQNPVPLEEAKPITDKIQALLPDYLRNYGFDEKIFLYPTKQEGTRNGIKVSKHILNYAGGALSSYGGKRAQLDKLVSSLGELWSKNRTSELDLEITISTTAKAFTLLGHYGPDEDSCFRNGSDKTADKYCLGQTKDTFVISIAKKRAEGSKKEGYKNEARCFGWATNNYTNFNICNYYSNPGFQEGDSIGALRALFEDLWKEESEFFEDYGHIEGSEVDKNIGSIYQNPYGKWSFVKGKGARIESVQYLKIDTDAIKSFNCKRCGRANKTNKDFINVDSEEMCTQCARNAYVCDVTGKYTFKKLVPIQTFKLFTSKVHPEFAQELFKCKNCERPFISEKGHKTCSECVLALFKDL